MTPKCYPKSRELKFFELTHFGQLEKTYYDLYEPKPAETAMIPLQHIDLMIVPGIAFTKTGYRLGFGGGYYDRLLTKFTGITVSLAFQEHIVEELPSESFDLPVGQILTDGGRIDCEC